jgi:predicted HAD superfamily Cof-like phosphohydrolase
MVRTMNGIASIAAVPTALQSATNAIQKSHKALEEAANVVARSGAVESRDTLEALIDSRQQLLYTKAAAKLIRAADEITQSLIDIRA